MSSTAQRFSNIEQRVTGLETRQFSITPTPLIYAAVGQIVVFGCLITPGASDADWVIRMEGQATGDEEHHNPDAEASPVKYWQYPNLASIKDGAFAALDADYTLEPPPPEGLARYDIAYVYVGPAGAGLNVAAGTPSSAIKDDYDLNGVVTTPYDPGTDAALPIGALPIARIYVEAVLGGVAAAQIADLRDFESRLKGSPLVWSDLTPSQKDELIDPAVAAATAAVLADNEEFKRTMRTFHWLGI